MDTSVAFLLGSRKGAPHAIHFTYNCAPQSPHTAATPNPRVRVGCSSYDNQRKLGKLVLNNNLNEQADHLYDPRANPGTYVEFDPYGSIVHSPSAGYGADLRR